MHAAEQKLHDRGRPALQILTHRGQAGMGVRRYLKVVEADTERRTAPKTRWPARPQSRQGDQVGGGEDGVELHAPRDQS